MRRQNLVTKQELKILKKITPITLTARPTTLKTHKNPVKLRSIIKTVVSAAQNIKVNR